MFLSLVATDTTNNSNIRTSRTKIIARRQLKLPLTSTQTQLSTTNTTTELLSPSRKRHNEIHNLREDPAQRNLWYPPEFKTAPKKQKRTNSDVDEIAQALQDDDIEYQLKINYIKYTKKQNKIALLRYHYDSDNR